MPTVDKTGKYDVQAENIGATNGALATQGVQNVDSSNPPKAKKSLSERSAFSETDLKGRLAATEGGNTTKDEIFTRYSESNIQLAKLDVPLFDDSRSEASGGSGLAIVPSFDGRSILSQDSGRELVPAVSSEVIAAGEHDEVKLVQEGKGKLNVW